MQVAKPLNLNFIWRILQLCFVMLPTIILFVTYNYIYILPYSFAIIIHLQRRNVSNNGECRSTCFLVTMYYFNLYFIILYYSCFIITLVFVVFYSIQYFMFPSHPLDLIFHKINGMMFLSYFILKKPWSINYASQYFIIKYVNFLCAGIGN